MKRKDGASSKARRPERARARNPCDKWFCNPAHFPKANGTDEGATKVFATTYSKVGSTVYPMAWDLANKDVAGRRPQRVL